MAIRALLVETWHATYDGIFGAQRVTAITDEWHSIPSLRARLTHPRSEFILAEDGRQIAGMAFAAAEHDLSIVMLRQLYVSPSRQRRGVGSMLLAEIEESFPEARLLRLQVEAKNEVAIRFYRKHGFELKVGAPGHVVVADGPPALVMEKSLG